jgi:hypothetical protein
MKGDGVRFVHVVGLDRLKVAPTCTWYRLIVDRVQYRE